MSFIVGLTISGISYFIHKEVSKDIESAEQLAKFSNNRVIKSAIAYYKKMQNRK